MAWQSDQTGYFDDLARGKRFAWVWSGLAAAGFNLALFLLMPHLMDPAPSRTSIETLVPQVNVIRIRRQETEVRRQTEKPPEPTKTSPGGRPEAVHSPPIKAKLTLPFEINPRLPSGPNTLALPPLEGASVVMAAGLPDAFSIGQLDAALTVLARMPPVYPMNARRRGIEGWVKVAFTVDETGRVDDVAILEAKPPGFFEESVERCVRGWRFKPGTVEGIPVKAKVDTTIRFELE
jgi:protein TonB